MSALFSFTLHEHPPMVLVYDRSKFGGRSVTNDAETVIEQIGRKVPDLAKRRVVYEDSTGRWDELLVTPKGNFAGFGILDAKDAAEAIRMVRERESPNG